MASDFGKRFQPTGLFAVACAVVAATCAFFVTVVGAVYAQGPAKVVAVVNGEAITVDDLEESLEKLHGEVGPTQRSSGSVERLLFKSVNDVLIGQEARSLGLHEESPVPEAIERNRRRLALSLLEREEITANSEPKEDEVIEVFEERYRRASFHVLTAADLEGAEEILEALRSGAELEVLALERSIDPYRDRGGLLEDVVRKDLQRAIANVVFQMAPDEVSGPVQTDLGWSVLVARSFKEPDPLIFEKVRPTLEQLVRQRKETAVRGDLFEQLKSNHAVTIDRMLVDSMRPVRRPDGRLTVESPGGEAVIARIGAEITLTGDEYAGALERRWRTIATEEAAAAAGQIILENLINERLLIAEAYDRGYGELPAVRRALHGLETEMVIPKYLNSVLAEGIEVSEDDKRAHYQEVKESLRRPPRLRLGQITVPTREEGETVAEALRGGSDLAWLAARHSTDGLKDRGGLQDWSTARPGSGPVNATLLASEVGTVLAPFELEDSWVVYKIVAREEQGVYPYEEVSGNMREAVFRKKFTEILDGFVKTARSRSEIEIREDVLAALRLSGTQEAESEAGHGGSGHGGNGHGGGSGHGGGGF